MHRHEEFAFMNVRTNPTYAQSNQSRIMLAATVCTDHEQSVGSDHMAAKCSVVYASFPEFQIRGVLRII